MKKIRWSRVWCAAAPGLALLVFAWLHLWLIQPFELDQSYTDRVYAKNMKLLRENEQLADNLYYVSDRLDELEFATSRDRLQRAIAVASKRAAW